MPPEQVSPVLVLLVMTPSVRACVHIVTHPRYRAQAAKHRAHRLNTRKDVA
jgi:hypothetical protein